MKFKAADRLLRLLGVDPERSVPMPRYRAISDGLLVTSTHSETVLRIATSNTDLLSDTAVLSEVMSALRTMGGALQGADFHLKIVWGRTTGETYRAEMAASGIYTTGDWERWLDDRAENISSLDMPSRYVLLHVVQGPREEAAQAALIDPLTDAFGQTTYGLSAKDHRQLMGRAQKLARQINQGPLTVDLAPAELIAWEIARESKRESSVAVPPSGTITGAPLATLARGRVQPFSDHLRFYAADGSIAAFSAVLAIVEFPEEVEVPGTDWLREISDITWVDDMGDEHDTLVEASVRGRILPTGRARKIVEGARTTAKEQRLSASKHSAQEPAEEILETEARMGEVGRELSRRGLRLVEFHPRLVVTAESMAELEAKTDAVIQHFADRGMTVINAVDDQRDMWLETLPGDHLRVADLRHVADAELFFGSLFWGGSAVGEPDGPINAWMTGSTPGFVRFDISRTSKQRGATTVGYFGLSGNGKSVSACLPLMEQGFMGGWNMLLDFKGDMGGLADVAREYDLPHGRTVITDSYSGSLDLFGAIPERDAAMEGVARQLQLLAPSAYRQVAEVATLAATEHIARTEDHPSTWAAIEWLRNHTTEEYKELGDHLARLASTSLGKPVLGPREASLALPMDPGIWVVQMPGLTLPSAEKSADSWDQTERLSMALMRSVVTTAIHMTSDPSVRSLPKTLMIPEVHRMLKVGDGAAFLDNIARTGSAYGTHLIIDSQDVTGIASHEGLAEQIASAFVFRLQSEPQLNAAAQLLGLDANDATRQQIKELSDPDTPDKDDRKGHCIMRDYRRRCARIQWQMPTQQILDLLDTNAYKDENPPAPEPETVAPIDEMQGA